MVLIERSNPLHGVPVAGSTPEAFSAGCAVVGEGTVLKFTVGPRSGLCLFADGADEVLVHADARGRCCEAVVRRDVRATPSELKICRTLKVSPRRRTLCRYRASPCGRGVIYFMFPCWGLQRPLVSFPPAITGQNSAAGRPEGRTLCWLRLKQTRFGLSLI